MVNTSYLALLRSLWRLSMVLAFPVIAVIYCRVMDMPFSELDQADGLVKLQVVICYIGYLILWLWINPRLSRGRR